MSHPFHSRERIYAEIRELVAPDPWMALYALWLACDELDLAQLTELVGQLDGARVATALTGNRQLAELLAERFGR